MILIAFGNLTSSLNAQSTERALQSEWAFFNATSDSAKAQILIEKSAYQRNDNLQEALTTIFRVENLNLNSVQQNETTTSKVLLYDKLREYDLGLYQIEKANQLDPTNDNYAFLKIWLLINAYQFEEADKQLYHFTQKNGIDSINTGYLISENLNWKKAKKARHLSAIAPGLGQLYVGKFGHSASSVLLIGAFSGYAILSFTTGYPISAILTGLTGAYRFYLGGLRNASSLAQTKNKKKAERLKKSAQSKLLKLLPIFQ